MRRKTLLVISGLLLFMPLTTRLAKSSECGGDKAAPRALADQQTYPAFYLSPKQSLKNYDDVFLAEVAVPSRPCSIGYCAGLRVLTRIKGHAADTVLVQVQRPSEARCRPVHFNHRGERWIVFGNPGTSKGGTPFIYAADEGPSFASSAVPDFNVLEGQYHLLRARLDDAIEEGIGHSKAQLR